MKSSLAPSSTILFPRGNRSMSVLYIHTHICMYVYIHILSLSTQTHTHTYTRYVCRGSFSSFQNWYHIQYTVLSFFLNTAYFYTSPFILQSALLNANTFHLSQHTQITSPTSAISTYQKTSILNFL